MAAHKDQELSIEEILDSIRQIISEDEPKSEAVTDTGGVDPGVGAGVGQPDIAHQNESDLQAASEALDDSDVLELTDVVHSGARLDKVAEPKVAEPKVAEPKVAEGVAIASEGVPDVPEVDMMHSAETEQALGSDADADEGGEAVDIFDDPADGEEDLIFVPSEPDFDASTDESDAGEGAGVDGAGPFLSERAEEVAASAFSELARKAAVDRSGLVSVEDIVREEIRPILRQWVDDHLPVMLERLLQEELDKISKRAIE